MVFGGFWRFLDGPVSSSFIQFPSQLSWVGKAKTDTLSFPSTHKQRKRPGACHGCRRTQPPRDPGTQFQLVQVRLQAAAELLESWPMAGEIGEMHGNAVFL